MIHVFAWVCFAFFVAYLAYDDKKQDEARTQELADRIIEKIGRVL